MRPPLARPGALATLLAAGLALAACGFTPMYVHPGLAAEMSAIQVAAPEGRVGFLLHEDLDDEFGRDLAAAPAWRLDLQINQTRSPRGLTIADVAERYELGLKVTYALTDISTGKVAHSGSVATEVAYDAAAQPYAGIAARQDSQARAAADAARRIRLELATWMVQQRQ